MLELLGSFILNKTCLTTYNLETDIKAGCLESKVKTYFNFFSSPNQDGTRYLQSNRKRVLS